MVVGAEVQGLFEQGRICGEPAKIRSANVVDTVRDFRHAFGNEHWQFVAVVNLRVHDGVSEFVREGAVEVRLVSGAFAVLVIFSETVIVRRVYNHVHFVNGAVAVVVPPAGICERAARSVIDKFQRDFVCGNVVVLEAVAVRFFD